MLVVLGCTLVGCAPPKSSLGKAVFGEQKSEREKMLEEQNALREENLRENAEDKERDRKAIERAASINAANDRRYRDEQDARDRERQKRQEADEAETQRLAQQYQEEEARKRMEREAIASIRPKAALGEFAVPALSAMICDERDLIAGHEQDLAQERQIAARSGVIDLSSQRYLGEAIQEGNERIVDLQRIIRQRYRVAPRKCADVRDIVECAHKDWKCDEPALTPALLWRHHPDALEAPETVSGTN
jgi:hypothetical protein